MTIATVSSKGQITLPAECRRALGIVPGTKVLVELEGDAIRISPAKGILSLRGCLAKALPPDEEERRMRDGVARHVEGKGQ